MRLAVTPLPDGDHHVAHPAPADYPPAPGAGPAGPDDYYATLPQARRRRIIKDNMRARRCSHAKAGNGKSAPCLQRARAGGGHKTDSPRAGAVQPSV